MTMPQYWFDIPNPQKDTDSFCVSGMAANRSSIYWIGLRATFRSKLAEASWL